MRAYHFVGATLRDGQAVPEDGEWLVHEGEIKMCESGLHASEHPGDALQYAPGPILCLVECEEIQEQDDDKFVCRRRKIIARFDATDLLRQCARWCALQVVDLWNAPPVVRQYLTTGDESLRADAERAAQYALDAALAATRSATLDAQDAARAAAWAAAWAALDATKDAAQAAAWAAARAAQDAAMDAQDDTLDAALDAAQGAVQATQYAARAAALEATPATWDASRALQRAHFKELVDAKFSTMGVNKEG